MGKLEGYAEKWNDTRQKVSSGFQTCGTVYAKIKYVIGVIVTVCYRLRKVVMAVPVVYYALQLARYNMDHLPQEVGINLQSTGEFAAMISRELAVAGPLGVTLACLILMFFSRKAMYPWAISIFTLVLPLLLLLSNQYPV